MFNFFKNKQNLIPNDVFDGMMTSKFCEIKPNAKINIDNNIVCFVSYKDKVYLTLTEGNHQLSEHNLKDLIAKQSKSGNPKQLKVDLFFVNKNPFNLTNSFTIKYPISKQKTKVRFEYTINLNVSDENKFLKTILTELALPNIASTNKVVFSYIDEIIYFYFLKKNLNSINLPFEIKDNLKQKIAKQISKIGLTLTNFNINLYPTDSKLNKTSIFVDNKENTNKEEIHTTQNNCEINTNTLDKPITNEDNIDKNICPNCGSKRIKNSIFCYRCGYKF